MDKRTVAIAILVAAVLFLVWAGLSHAQSQPGIYTPLPCNSSGFLKYNITDYAYTQAGYKIYFDKAETYNYTDCSGQSGVCMSASYLYATFHFTDRQNKPLGMDYGLNALIQGANGYSLSMSQGYPFYAYDPQGNQITLQVCPVPGDENAIFTKITEKLRSVHNGLQGTYLNNTDCPSLDASQGYGGYEVHNMGQWMRAGGWAVTPADVLPSQGASVGHPVVFEVNDEQGGHVDFVEIPVGASYIFYNPYEGQDYSIDLCRSAPSSVGLNSRWAEFRVVQLTNNTIYNSSSPGCVVTPSISVEPSSLSLQQGEVGRVKMIVRGTQPASCGRQLYGMDFTNAYDADLFSLGITDVNGANKFYLWPGEVRTFEGLVGATGSIYSGNYTLQVTAYSDADHWKQTSTAIKVEVSPGAAGAAYWKSPLKIGWNAIPYVEGAGAYGCPEITEAYTYILASQNYVRLQRYGPIFALPNATYAYSKPEKFGGLFVFSKGRCTMESRVDAEEFANTTIWLFQGQLLSIPPAWNGATLASISTVCIPQAPEAVLEASRWDANKQEWIELKQTDALESGQAYRISSQMGCQLDANAKPG